MKQTGQETWQALLTERKTQLSERVHARLHGHGLERHDEAALPRRSEDTDDDAAAETQRTLDLVQIEHTAAALAEVETAIRRLDEGRYGLCVDCGKEIDTARLRAQPTALRCTRCQATREKVRP